jgi:hypothetical protein
MMNTEESLPNDVKAALDAYRKKQSDATWTRLSQLWIGDIQVVDALKRQKPDFPDPYPLPVDALIEESSEFYEWPALPDPDDVRKAILAAVRDS